MDEDFIVALHKMLRATAKAHESGMDLTRADQEAFMRQATGGKFGLDDAEKFVRGVNTSINPRNIGRSLYQGATFNFGDELMGLVPDTEGGAKGSLQGAAKFGAGHPLLQLIGAIAGYYGGGEKAKAQMRTRDEMFREQHPVADAVAGGIGSVGTAVASAPIAGSLGLAGEAATLGRAVRTGAGVGAVIGGTTAAGRGEGLADRAMKGAGGAVGGAVAGGVAPAAGAYWNLLRDPQVRAEQRLLGAVRKAGGTKLLKQRNQEFADAGLGDVAMLGDLDPRLQQELDFVANNSDDVYTALQKVLYGRRAGRSGRLLDSIRRVAGDADAGALKKRMSKKLDDWADAAYDELRANNQSVDFQNWMDLLRNPEVVKFWEQAKRRAVSTGEGDPTGLDFRAMEHINKRLGDKVSALKVAGKRREARDVQKVASAFAKRMRESFPGYRDVANEYSRRAKVIEALDAGKRAWHTVDSRGLKTEMDTLTPSQLDAWRKGMISEMIVELRNKATNRNAANEIVAMSPAMKDKLLAAFGSEENFNNYFRTALKESEMSRSLRAVGGSPTHRRDAAEGASLPDFDLLELGEKAVGAPASLLKHLVRLGSSVGKHALGRKTANRMAPMLMVQGTAPVDALLTQLATETPAVVGRGGTHTLPAAVASLFDNDQ